MTEKRGMSRSIMMVPGVSKKLFAKYFLFEYEAVQVSCL